jgi:hypothetical protein
MQRKDPVHGAARAGVVPATAARPVVSVDPGVRRRRIAAVRDAMRGRNRIGASVQRAE